MGKIVTFDTFCYRRELKAMEKEIAKREEELKIKEAQQRDRISNLIGYAKGVHNDPDDNPVDND